MSIPRVRTCSPILCSLAVAAGCASAAPPAPDAAPSPFPTSPAGTFALSSQLELRPPSAAAPVLAVLRSATDGPDDPTRFLVDRMIACLPDGTVKSLATQVAPYLAAYLNARLADTAPRLVPGLAALAGGLDRLATHLETVESLRIDRDGVAVRTITGVRFALGGAVVAARFADTGLPDITATARVSLDATGRLAIADHVHRLPYGAVLRLGLERAVVPSIEPAARDLASALAAVVECDRVGAVLAERVGLGAPAIYRAACRAATTAIAGELAARLAEIDEAALALEVIGVADAIDLDGDGAMDEVRAGRWSGAVVATGAREPIDAGAFMAARAP